jgi:hypothetical protein
LGSRISTHAPRRTGGEMAVRVTDRDLREVLPDTHFAGWEFS